MKIQFKQVYKEWRGALIFLALMLVFRSALADWVTVPSGSMNPTVLEGDRVLVDKRAYGLRIPFTLTRIAEVGNPQRGDVVILESPEDRVTLLKRVVAVPGDVVELDNEQLIINGQLAHYDSLPADTGAQLLDNTKAADPIFLREQLLGVSHTTMIMPQIPARRSFTATTIPPGKYLMMGDNRDNSKDSRYFGLVDRNAIFGKALRIAVSLNPENYYLPRAHRFMQPAL